jgi:polyketide biosynthesis acyl carrier protein
MSTDATATIRERVTDTVERNLRLVLPDLPADAFRPEVSMSDLGADSMDRMDVVIGTLDDLGLELAGDRLAGVRDIGTLIEALCAYARGEAGESATGSGS